jgi:biopolymer transport protein ExbD
MASQRGIQARRGRRKINKAFELQLTSMMDVLVIIVVFLLKSYNVSMNSFTTPQGLQLPISSSQDTPNDSVQVIVTPESLTVESERILDFLQTSGDLGNQSANYSFKQGDLDEGGLRVVPLYDALMKARAKTELLLAKSAARVDGKPIPFEGILAIQADKKIKYDTVKKIMYTAGTAGFKIIKFLALKKET